MGGTYTSSRWRPRLQPLVLRNSSGVDQKPTTRAGTPPGYVDFGGEQITTSFRSSGPGKDLDLRADIQDKRWSSSSTDDNGHEFSTQTSWLETHSRLTHISSKYYTSGPAFWEIANLGNNFVADPFFDMGFYGPNAIKRTVPTRPEFQPLVTIGELLREGLPNLAHSLIPRVGDILSPRLSRQGRDDVQRYIKDIQEGSSLYLGVNFGLMPIVSDIVKMVRLAYDATKIIQQLVRDNGQQVRRGCSFPVVETTTSAGNTYVYRAAIGVSGITAQNPSTGVHTPTTTRRTTRSVWFKGAYTYFLPDKLLDSLEGNMAIADKLFGLRHGAEAAWALMPYSWLSDWILNINDAISVSEEFSRNDLTLRYGYLMSKTLTRLETVGSFRIAPKTRNVFEDVTVRSSYATLYKKRYRASPFGFGLKPADFSDWQKSILAALAISRV